MTPVLPEARLMTQALRDRLARGGVPRTPEPMVMDDEESVAAFHVAHPVYQLPAYRLNAEAMSRLLPEGGTVLDLGSGSGQLLAHLARARPDIQVTGTDLAETMLETGRELLQASGLEGRVELRRADMTELPPDLPESIDLISTAWALHHLPTREHLSSCLGEIARIREQTGCAVWIFDFAQLRREATMRAVLDLATDSPPRLREDGHASLRAAWSESELRDAMAEAGLSELRGGRERIVGFLQAYHAPAREPRPSGHAANWAAAELPRESRRMLRMVRAGLPGLPT